MKKIMLTFLISTFLSCVDDTEKMETEMMYRLNDKVTEWYYSSESIDQKLDREGDLHFRDEKKKAVSIDLAKLKAFKKNNISAEEWNYLKQDFSYVTLNEVYNSATIKVETYFKKDQLVLVHRRLYFYNIDEMFIPMCMEDLVYLIDLQKRDTEYLSKKYIWKSDFEGYLQNHQDLISQ
ncbi:MAG: hypothetical protein COA80_19100 [Leeuwenhoekiella sp.]|nr:MAG: hypothetical protein COA80_19100 [Leeuwenhoekiella sp.]